MSVPAQSYIAASAGQRGWLEKTARMLTEDGSIGLWLLIVVGSWLVTAIAAAIMLTIHWPFLVQDDARHFVVWLSKRADPALFPNDPIAHYFLILTPWFYEIAFGPFQALGLETLAIHPLIFMAIGGLAFSAAFFFLVYRLWPSAPVAGLATLLAPLIFGKYVLQGLPRSFSVLILVLLIYGFINRRMLLTAATMVLGTGLYPAASAVGGVAMGLLCFSPRPPFLQRDWRKLMIVALAACAALGGAYVFLSGTASLGPTFAADEARDVAIFQPSGRTAYFEDDPVKFYFCAERSGFAPFCRAEPPEVWLLGPLIALLPFVVVILLWRGQIAGLAARWDMRPPDPQLASVILAVAVGGLLLHAAAHLLAFKLHLPNRYGGLAYLLALALATLPVAAAWIVSRMRQGLGKGQALGVIASVALLAFGAQAVSVSKLEFVTSNAAALHRFLQETPKDTLIAGLTKEMDNVPAFSRRSAYLSLELAVPYKIQQHRLIESRAAALSSALYSAKPDSFRRLIEKSGIDYLLLDREREDQLRTLRRWNASFSAVRPALDFLRRGRSAFFEQGVGRCTRVSENGLRLVDVHCLVAQETMPAPASEPGGGGYANSRVF